MLDKEIQSLRERLLQQYKDSESLKFIPEKSEPYGNPNSMDEDAALILYIVVMLVGTIFYARILIWISATAIYVIFRRQFKKKK